MSRPLRIEYPGAVYHVTSRGNRKKAIFEDDHDRESLLNALQHVNKQYNWICHAYCLMNNHYHLLIETSDGNLSIGMRQLNGVYTQLFNKWHGKTGHLLQGRYKAILIQKGSHLLEVCRYVVLNPVRAKMVERPEDYTLVELFSHGRKGKAPSLLDHGLGARPVCRKKSEGRERVHEICFPRTRADPAKAKISKTLTAAKAIFLFRVSPFRNFDKPSNVSPNRVTAYCFNVCFFLLRAYT